MRFRVLHSGILISGILFVCSVSAYAQRRNLAEYRDKFAPYVNSPEHAVDKMLRMANLHPGETLYDLGCGDGRIVIAAAERYKVKAVGIEISENLAKATADKVKKAGLEDRVKVIHGNFMRMDLSNADVVTLYLATTANESLRPNLERYLRPNSRVVSYDYPIPGWKPVDTAESEGRHGASHVIYLYQVPNSIVKK